MKLSRIYSNQDAVFPSIQFNDGLNVVCAEIRHKEDKSRDTHNLGKTLLAQLIDFLLLKEVRKDFFLVRNADRFADFAFYLEIAQASRYITVRRSVANRNDIFFTVQSVSQSNIDTPADQWEKYGIRAAVRHLNELLRIAPSAPDNYRKLLGFCIRAQDDFRQVFEVGDFHSTDDQWKPAVFGLLGFNRSLLEDRYAIGKEITKEEDRLQDYQADHFDVNDFDHYKGLLAVKSDELESVRAQINRFSFQGVERELNEVELTDIETSVANHNDRLYTINYELKSIDASLDDRIRFDMAQVEKLYKEVNVYFADQIKADYEKLLEFNRNLSEDRNGRLKSYRQQLLQEKTNIENELHQLDLRRVEIIGILDERDTFDKFRKLQGVLLSLQDEVSRLNSHLNTLQLLHVRNKEIKKLQSRLSEIVDLIDTAIRDGNETYEAIRSTFTDFVRRVVGATAILSVKLNSKDNVSFDAAYTDTNISRVTSGDEGTSYRKMLCAALDIALAEVYSSSSYYRFLYHDGILEGLDNRKKLNLLDYIRRDFCEKEGLQYITTLIDSDLPVDDENNPLPFEDGEIVRRLHDDGDSGRLFMMPEF